jgi:uncharacterized phage protein (TIGR02220 family)
MGIYAKIERSIWGNPKFKALSDDAKMLFVYILTCKHGNMLGCFELPIEYAASDMKWGLERVSKGYRELFRNGFITVCEGYSIVLINNFLKHNQLENPNTVKAALKLFNQIPDKSIVKGKLARAITKFCKHASSPESVQILKPFLNGIETVSEPYAKPVSVTETDNSNIALRALSTSQSTSRSLFKNDAIEVLNFLNEKTGRFYRAEDSNLDLIIARLQSGITMQNLRAIIAKKCREWNDDVTMKKYLRPKTLFNKTNCEQYYGELNFKREVATEE